MPKGGWFHTPQSTFGPTRTAGPRPPISIRVLGGVAEPIGKFIAAKLGVPYELVWPRELQRLQLGHICSQSCLVNDLLTGD